MFEFELPVARKKVVWKPLDVGQQLQLAASYQGNQQVMRSAAMLADRIIQFGDQPSLPGTKACPFPVIQTWDEIDYNEFSDHVEREEAKRYAAYKKKESPSTAMAKAQDAVNKAGESLIAAIKSMNEAMQELKDAQLAASASPLSAK